MSGGHGRASTPAEAARTGGAGSRCGDRTGLPRALPPLRATGFTPQSGSAGTGGRAGPLPHAGKGRASGPVRADGQAP
ncbi:protein of unassigned function [Methylobacterium oryzae CBMB20]|uniref:Protein of unassigned function n=1 Tax=Methylobacterium oryzae CBMB20 TaxID=693986 RepID=A0A089P423_9HYPH|nr:protein of unassigned function [Methylobacterium oryzae CBMB20]